MTTILCRLPSLLIPVTAILMLLTVAAVAAPKTDIIIFKNGDRLTGEIKKLKRGSLTLSTDAISTVNIEWDKISEIISNQNIQVELASGARYFGPLIKPDKEGFVLVQTKDGPQSLDVNNVITMSPIEKTVYDRFDIDLSFGYNFAKSTGVKTGTMGIDVDYRTLLRIYSVSMTTTISDSNGQDASKRQNLTLDYTRLWKDRWVTVGSLTLDQNDELGLNLRTSLGMGGGRYLIQSNTMLLELLAGLQLSRENDVNQTEDTDSVELVLAGSWDWFRTDDPKLDFSTQLQVIPSLTQSGRVRGELDSSVKWEIIHDLKLGLSFYSSYDNQPSDTGATNDYGINTTLTYEF